MKCEVITLSRDICVQFHPKNDIKILKKEKQEGIFLAIKLPTEKTTPKPRLEDYIVFLYGSPKIGKTTFCSQFDNPLFLLTEAGTNALSVYEIPIQSWAEFKEAGLLVAKGLDEERKGGAKFPFKTLVIDTVDNLIRFCSEHVLKQHGLTHESDLGFGKGYSYVEREFRSVITRLSLMPVGLVMISHEKIEEVKTRASVINKAVPTISNAHRKIVLGMADLILYAHTVQRPSDNGIEEVRVLRTKGGENWEAGDRTGKLPDALPFNYTEFMKAWDGTKEQKSEKKEGNK